MSFNAGEREDIKEKEREARVAERARYETLQTVMSTRPGRQWMLEILSKCHIFASCFNTNALTMAALEGERNIGLQHLNDIMVCCPEQYVEMMREENERQNAANARSERNEAKRRNRTSGGGESPGSTEITGDLEAIAPKRGNFHGEERGDDRVERDD